MEYEAFSEAKIDPLGNTNDSIPNNRAQFGDESSLNSLNKSSLCSIAAQLEAELEAFHFVLSSLKKDNLKKHKVLLQYGQLNATDPFSALHRDTQLLNTFTRSTSSSAAPGKGHSDSNGTAAAAAVSGSDVSGSRGGGGGQRTSSCEDACLHQASMVTHQPLLFVEELVKTHKRNLNRLGVQILHLERRYHKALTDLEEEKKKHSADQAVGEEVAYHLEKERDKLVLKLEEEQGARKNMENNLVKMKQLLMNERSRRQSDTVKLLKDRQALVYKLYNEKKLTQTVRDSLAAETGRVGELNSVVDEWRGKCGHLESRMQLQSSEDSRSGFEKQQLELKLTRSEKQCSNLQEEIIRLKERIYELEKGGHTPASDIPEIVESRQPLSQPAQQPRREYAPPPNMHSHGGAVVKMGAGSSANISGMSASALSGLNLTTASAQNLSQVHSRSPSSTTNNNNNISSSSSSVNINPVQSPSAAAAAGTLNSQLGPGGSSRVSPGTASGPTGASPMLSSPGQQYQQHPHPQLLISANASQSHQANSAKRNLNGRFPLDETASYNGPVAPSGNLGSAPLSQAHIQSLAAQFAASHSHPSLAVSPTDQSPLGMERLSVHTPNGLDASSHGSQDHVDFGSGDSGSSGFQSKKNSQHSGRNSNSFLALQQHHPGSSASSSRPSPPNSEFNLFANTLPVMTSTGSGFSNRSTIPNSSIHSMGTVGVSQQQQQQLFSSNHSSLSQMSATLQQQNKQFQQQHAFASSSYQNMTQPKYRISTGPSSGLGTMGSTGAAGGYGTKLGVGSGTGGVLSSSSSGTSKPDPPARTSSSLSHQNILGNSSGQSHSHSHNQAATATSGQ